MTRFREPRYGKMSVRLARRAFGRKRRERLLLDLRPRVTKRDRAIEQGPTGPRQLAVRNEVAAALELEALARARVRERGLERRVLDDDQRARVQLLREIVPRKRAHEQPIVEAHRRAQRVLRRHPVDRALDLAAGILR